MANKEDIWVPGKFSHAYVCGRCGHLAYYWTDDFLKHPAQTDAEFEEWYKYHEPYCANNIRIIKPDD